MRAALGFGRLALVLSVPFALAGCVGEPPKTEPAGVDEVPRPTASTDEHSLDPSDFVKRIDNPWLPLEPGRSWTYRSVSSDGPQQITVTVLEETKDIDGVTATVVHDVVTGPRGKVLEDTYDWYAQDKKGNVWYLGEATTEYDGKSSSTAGSWQAGVDGARAGIAMLARPRVGDGYKQEFLKGEAEDQAQVIELDAEVVGPAGSWVDEVLVTKDTTPLEPDLVEHKFYVQGIGVVRELTVEGGDEEVELVKFTVPAGETPSPTPSPTSSASTGS
ncbi:hypothetical protein [Nocardioides cavernaquae]|uniref:Lipoprotein n=1 Tax=Nocardioides cavernaquae TaxID=2321396 RepID=A0A3A5H7U3_9ACTN|nr:hypothetical protein [Nocardioides cavernaquae]RJS46522.1 hypothetical protein D4739_10065 [Nocardioides cavernaquae]